VRRLFCQAVVALAALCAATATGSTATGSTGATRLPRLEHVIVVVFENKEKGEILGSGSAPNFDRLASSYAEAPAYFAVAHPSLPNYFALVSGSTHGVTSDCTDCPQRGPTIGTQLSAAHLSWAAYGEGYPASGDFVKKHMPFLYFPGGASHVRNLSALKPTKLPAYALVIPDLCHDMHDCSVATGDRWLGSFIAPLLRVRSTAIFIVFDEGTTNAGGGGRVPLIVAGQAVRPHSVFAGNSSHYGLLHTVESLLGLSPVGLARAAPVLTGIWRTN
jgi:hypothetical protein